MRLLAVSKQQPAARRAGGRGGRAVATSARTTLQEALAKIEALRDLPLTWHFIGQLQANKTRDVAERFQWVHTLDRAADRRAAERPAAAPRAARSTCCCR